MQSDQSICWLIDDNSMFWDEDTNKTAHPQADPQVPEALDTE